MSYFIALFPVIIWTLLKSFPPKSINKWYGYRSSISTRNGQYWAEGNRYSNQFYIYAGLLALVAAFISNYLQFKNAIFLTAMVVATCMIAIVPLTENHLRKTFKIKK